MFVFFFMVFFFNVAFGSTNNPFVDNNSSNYQTDYSNSTVQTPQCMMIVHKEDETLSYKILEAQKKIETLETKNNQLEQNLESIKTKQKSLQDSLYLAPQEDHDTLNQKLVDREKELQKVTDALQKNLADLEKKYTELLKKFNETIEKQNEIKNTSMLFQKMYNSLAKNDFKPVRNFIRRSSLIFFSTSWGIGCIYGIYLRSVYLQSRGDVVVQQPGTIDIDPFALILFLSTVFPWIVVTKKFW